MDKSRNVLSNLKFKEVFILLVPYAVQAFENVHEKIYIALWHIR